MESTGGEEVNDFLQRIRELGDKRDREDDERTKQLERDIIAGREARRARRDGAFSKRVDTRADTR